MDDSAITHEEIIQEETKTATINFNEKKMQSISQKISLFRLPSY